MVSLAWSLLSEHPDITLRTIFYPRKSPRNLPRPPPFDQLSHQGLFLYFSLVDFVERGSFFLKQLGSGLLLVTGPYKINGVPLRRVNQAYVIATSTKVNISNSIAEQISDGFFAADSKSAKGSAESEFFDEGKPKAKAPFPEAKAKEQREVDKVIVEAIRKEKNLGKYLQSSWGLVKGQFPHEIVF